MVTLEHLILKDMQGSNSDMLEPAAMWIGGCSQSPALQSPTTCSRCLGSALTLQQSAPEHPEDWCLIKSRSCSLAMGLHGPAYDMC